MKGKLFGTLALLLLQLSLWLTPAARPSQTTRKRRAPEVASAAAPNAEQQY